MPSLLGHNTFGIDAQCRALCEYDNVERLRTLLAEVRGGRFLHIGAGSNLLFTADYDGTVLHSRIGGIEEVGRTDGRVRVRAGAGVVWDDFVSHCTAHGWHGLENLSYIPGEVGASAVQNIGAYGVEVGDHIRTVETVEVATGRARTFDVGELAYAYRSSAFKHGLRGQYVVTHVTYDLSLTFAPDLDYAAVRRELDARGIPPSALTAKGLRQMIIEVRRSKLPEPSETGSAGSFFMNPIVSEATFEALRAQYPAMPHYLMPDGGVKIPAGWLIEQCGWKGRTLGRAGVWPKQALVLVNLGGATGTDIVHLCEAIRHDVSERFGIDLHPEVNFI